MRVKVDEKQRIGGKRHTKWLLHVHRGKADAFDLFDKKQKEAQLRFVRLSKKLAEVHHSCRL